MRRGKSHGVPWDYFDDNKVSRGALMFYAFSVSTTCLILFCVIFRFILKFMYPLVNLRCVTCACAQLCRNIMKYRVCKSNKIFMEFINNYLF